MRCAIVGVFAALLSMPGLVRAEQLVCPEQLNMAQTLSSTAPEGWVSFDEARGGRHVFLNATISDGKPEDIAYLTPDKELKQGKDVVQVFKFNPSITPWLRCEYSGTTVVLSKPLSKGYKECRVTLDHVHNNQQTKRIDCQ